jgi:hypothetical protein
MRVTEGTQSSVLVSDSARKLFRPENHRDDFGHTTGTCPGAAPDDFERFVGPPESEQPLGIVTGASSRRSFTR